MATQQTIRKRIDELATLLADESLHPLDRIKYLCEQGIILRTTTDMARSLREISEIVETL